MRRRSSYRRGVALTAPLVPEPEPTGEATASVLAATWGLQMAGHNGSVPIGEKSSPMVRFTGYAPSPQLFIGAGTYGAKQGPLPNGMQPALPNTQAPPGLPGAMQSMFPRSPS